MSKQINSNPEKVFQAATEMASEPENLSGRQLARCLFYAGLAKNYLNDYQAADSLLRYSIEISEKANDDQSTAGTLQALGVVLENKGLMDEALAAYTMSYEIFETLDSPLGTARSLTNIGCVLLKKKDFEGAGSYLQNSLQIAREQDDLNIMALNYNNLGILNDLTDNPQRALDYYQKALKIQQQLENSRVVGMLLNNIGLIYSDQEKYQQALATFNQSVVIKKRLNLKEGLAKTLNSIGEIFLQLNKMDSAYLYLNSARRLGEEYRNWEIIKNSNRLLSDYYLRSGNPEKALEYFKVAATANDSLYNVKMTQKITEMQTRFRSKQQEKKNALLTERVAHHRTWLLMAGIIVLIALVFLVILYRMFRFRSVSLQKTRTILEQEKAMAQLHEAQQKSELKHLESEKRRKESENKLLENRIKTDAEINRLEKEKLNAVIEMRSKELSGMTVNIIANNDNLKRIENSISEVMQGGDDAWKNDLQKLKRQIRSQVDPELTWKKYRMNFEMANPGFFDRLMQQFPDLTMTEQKLCAFLRVRLQTKEMAQIMNVSVAAVNKGRQRLRKSLNLPPRSSLDDYLNNI